jgi:GntR family transcriptional repressor for pyruvate dehydrogenase complex
MRSAKDDLRVLPTLDVEFHRVIAEMTGNELFVILIDSVGDVMTEVRDQTLGLRGRPARALEYHAAILEAIETKDARSARRAVEEHLRESASAWSHQVRTENNHPNAPAPAGTTTPRLTF